MNKNKKFFKSKLQMVIYLTIFVLLFAGFIYFGNKDYSKEVKNTKIEEQLIEFEDDNIFTKINASDALSYVKRKNVIMIFGINNEYVLNYGNIISEVAKEKGIDTIYYYDIEKDREENNASYRSMLEYLSDTVTYFEEDKSEIYAPTVLVKSNNKVLYYDNSLAITNGYKDVTEVFTEENILVFKAKYEVIFDNYLEGVNNGK